MPEGLAAPRIETARARGFHKPGYSLVISGSEIERFVEFPGAGQLERFGGRRPVLSAISAKVHA